MEIFGVGAPELIFILIIAIIVLGPKDMQKAGRTVGGWLNRLVNSEGWKTLKDTTQALQALPSRLMREANMEVWEAQQDIRNAIDPRAQPSASSRGAGGARPEEHEDRPETSPGTPPENPPNSTPHQSDKHD